MAELTDTLLHMLSIRLIVGYVDIIDDDGGYGYNLATTSRHHSHQDQNQQHINS